MIVVLGAYANEIRAEIENLEANIIENQDWQQGMSTSVKAGLQQLLEINPHAEAALFMLTDQPLLTSAHLMKLIDARNQKSEASIIASFYNNKNGVPALFDKKWFDALLQLTGDQGARALFQQFSNEVLAVPFPEAAFDLDTPDDYKKFIG